MTNQEIRTILTEFAFELRKLGIDIQDKEKQEGITTIIDSYYKPRPVNEITSELISKETISIQKIFKHVCRLNGIDIDIAQCKTRKREVVLPRQITHYFCKKLTKHTLDSIGNKVGGKDHATVLYSVNTVSNLIDTDKKFKKNIDCLEKYFRNKYICKENN
ncbi:MAG: helix-turn-helix domain-containing protein [Bacteroidota bacterium]